MPLFVRSGLNQPKFSYILLKYLFASKQTQKSHLGQLLFINGSLRLIRTYWAEIEISGHLCHCSHVLSSISRNLATFCENVCLHLNRPKKVIWFNFCTLKVLLDSFVHIGPRQKKVDIYATIRTQWAELAEIQLHSVKIFVCI